MKQVESDLKFSNENMVLPRLQRHFSTVQNMIDKSTVYFRDLLKSKTKIKY